MFLAAWALVMGLELQAVPQAPQAFIPTPAALQEERQLVDSEKQQLFEELKDKTLAIVLHQRAVKDPTRLSRQDLHSWLERADGLRLEMMGGTR